MSANPTSAISIEQARNFVNSIKVPPFNPYLSSNPNFQTIVSNFWPRPPSVEYTRIKLPTSDGLDELDIDIAGGTTIAPEKNNPSKPVVLLLHGLESCSTGTQTLRLANAFSNAGFKVLALNYRSCAADAKPPVTLKLYHAGFTEDAETVLLAIRNAARSINEVPPRVYVCGFSLGANILCNLLRMVGERATEDYGIVGAFGFCIPFDPKNSQATIDSGYRKVYSSRLARSIVDRFLSSMNSGVDVSQINVEKVRKAQTIGEVDQEIIAPVFGFDDKFDYYRKVDARPCLKHVTVPFLILNAQDDPFFGHEDGKSLPSKEVHFPEAPVRLVISQSGGHCGFLDRAGATQTEPMYGARLCVQFAQEVENTFYTDVATASKAKILKVSSVESYVDNDS